MNAAPGPDARTRPAAADLAIAIRGVGKVFATDPAGAAPVLGAVDLGIRDNEFVVLLGRSGCGKTTLLNIVAGLEQATAGEVLVGGSRVTGPGGGKGMVFQQNALFPWLTAAGNIMFAAENRGMARPAAQALADDLLRLVGLDGVGAKYPANSPAACSSAWRSPGRWRSIRPSC